MTAKPPSCTLVVFGVTGDLTKRLLLPALRTSSENRALAQNLLFKHCRH